MYAGRKKKTKPGPSINFVPGIQNGQFCNLTLAKAMLLQTEYRTYKVRLRPRLINDRDPDKNHLKKTDRFRVVTGAKVIRKAKEILHEYYYFYYYS